MARRTMMLLATVLAAAIGLETAAWAVESSPAPAAKSELPKDVATYVERRTGCNHWMGEDAYDKARGREIGKAIKELGCDRLDAEERRLRERYRASPEISKALTAAQDAD